MKLVVTQLVKKFPTLWRSLRLELLDIILSSIPRYLKLFFPSRFAFYIHFLSDSFPTNLITLIVFSKKYKLWSCSLCSFHQHYFHLRSKYSCHYLFLGQCQSVLFPEWNRSFIPITSINLLILISISASNIFCVAFSGNMTLNIMALDEHLKTPVMTHPQEKKWRLILLKWRNCCSRNADFRSGKL